jgi:hypothetical protein
VNPERAEGARLLRELGRPAKVISANYPELTEAQAEQFIRTGKLPASERQLQLFGTANAATVKTETRHGGKPCGPLLAFAKPTTKEPTSE